MTEQAEPAWKKWGLPAGVIAIGVLVFVVLLKGRPEAAKGERAEQATPVTVLRVQSGPEQTLLHSTGVVVAEQTVQLSPEVSGQLVRVSSELRKGAIFARGDFLASINPSDYQLAVTQAESAVKQAEVQLLIEQGRSRSAQKEWALVGEGRGEEEAPLALRAPQLASAELSLQASEAQLQTRQLALSRTRLSAPFNAMVLAESMDAGQVVGPGNILATLVGTDRFLVEAQVRVEDLLLLKVPGFGSEEGSSAQVTQHLSKSSPVSQTIQRVATVMGMGGQIDSSARTATLLLAIEDPLGLQEDSESASLPLLPGAYVDLQIQGKQLDEVIAVPRSAAWEGSKVWVVTEASRLEQREVEVAWSDADRLFLTGGLQDGEAIVTSPLSLPVDGMLVSITTEEQGLSRAAPEGAEG